MKKPDFNGPGRELTTEQNHLDKSVYCVNCGNIFVSNAPNRDCPTCTVASMIEDLQDE